MNCAGDPVALAMYGTATGAWLRHSKECGTSWVRMWGARIGDRIEFAVSGRAGSVRDAEVTNSEQTNTYIYDRDLPRDRDPGLLPAVGENGGGAGEEGVLCGADALTRACPT